MFAADALEDDFPAFAKLFKLQSSIMSYHEKLNYNRKTF